MLMVGVFFFFSSRRRHTRLSGDWSSDVCSSDLVTTDYSRCVGCWMCVMTCPFGAIQAVYEEKLARKCDGCTSYEIPPCVAACKPAALRVEGYGNYAQARRRAFATRARAAAL